MTRLALLLAASLFAGCATFDRNEITSLRGRGVSAPVMEKLERGHALTPTDVIELRRLRVPDPWVIRQLEDHDVDSLVTRSDITAMRRAGVSQQVITAVGAASERFLNPYSVPPYGTYGWVETDPWGFYDPYPYGSFGSVGIGFVAPIHGHGHDHHHRHRH